MTYTEVKAAVVAYAKADVPSGGKVSVVVDDCIKRAYYWIVRSRPFPEFLQNRTSATLTSSSTTGIVTFTTWGLLLDIKEVRFAVGSVEWTLDNEDGRIKPAGIEGRPKAWRKIGSTNIVTGDGDKLYIEPFSAIIEASDKCYVTWWKIPLQLAASGTGTISDTTPISHSIDAELVDRALAEVLIYYGKEDKAKLVLSKYIPPPQSQPQNSNG